MLPLWQIPRNGALWLLVAFIVTVLPLGRYLPLWVPAIAVVALGWQTGIYRGRWGAPGRWLKLILVVGCIAGLLISFKRLYGLEPMVAMLVCAFSLKLLEMHQRRDALVVVFLGYFVAVTLALFDQGLVTAVYVAVAIAFVTASLAGLHQGAFDHRHYRPLFQSLRILAQALPLMVVFFLVMPRLAPLWNVPSSSSGTTGMSNSLELGDISRLGRSSAIAFRVDFEGDIPSRENLYWRGLTLSRFDGQRWTQADWGHSGGLVQWQAQKSVWRDSVVLPQGDAITYRVALEKHSGNWLYSLWLPQTYSAGTGVLRDLTLVSPETVTRRMEYRVTSMSASLLDAGGLSPVRERVELQLPTKSNPETVALARRWAAESPSTEALINRLLNYYRNTFYYTLSPPPLGQHAIDDFLFRSQQGFCEHFAASFVFFMRAAGIPARIVAGYQGGEIHPDGGYLSVRQYDAHAWGEVWLEGRGWVKVDPTAAVAPERILNSLLDLMPGDEIFTDAPFDLARFRSVAWLNRLRLSLESLEYGWAKWVLGYQNVQSELLTKLLGRLDSLRIAGFLLLASLVSLLPVIGFSFYSRIREKQHPADRYYQLFCRRL
ncbi:MAG: transglutaminaseTgpA domain-containing protein, partial [Porticoccaceae bacterium]